MLFIRQFCSDTYTSSRSSARDDFPHAVTSRTLQPKALRRKHKATERSLSTSGRFWSLTVHAVTAFLQRRHRVLSSTPVPLLEPPPPPPWQHVKDGKRFDLLKPISQFAMKRNLALRALFHEIFKRLNAVLQFESSAGLPSAKTQTRGTTSAEYLVQQMVKILHHF